MSLSSTQNECRRRVVMGGSGSKVGLEGVLGVCRNGAKGRVNVYSKCAIRARDPTMNALLSR